MGSSECERYKLMFQCEGVIWNRNDSMFVPSQWETALLCNDVSHWLGANIESALGNENIYFPPKKINNVKGGKRVKTCVDLYFFVISITITDVPTIFCCYFFVELYIHVDRCHYLDNYLTLWANGVVASCISNYILKNYVGMSLIIHGWHRAIL